MKAERTFRLPDLLAFAELSGDYNPLHTDPIAARRTHFGECVTHGVFVLMWALDSLQKFKGSSGRWTRVNAKFLRPVISGMTVTAIGIEKGPGHFTVTVTEQGRTLLQCDLTFADSEDGFAAIDVKGALPPREIPQAISPAELPKSSQPLDLYWPEEHGRGLFPSLAATQRPSALAALLASTRVVGMKVPGEHSIFLQLDLTFAPAQSASLPFAYRVSEFRQSSQRVAIALEGSACHGILWALVRPAPVSQAAMQIVKQHVPAGRFGGCRVIVIGGSRGLGEIAAKILAAGGAEVAVSYRIGQNDARKVVEDILAYGGNAFAFQLDLLSPDWETNLASQCSGFTHLCYFATPTLTEGDGATLNKALFARFCSVYVDALVNLSQWLAKRSNNNFSLFYASTVAVEEPPLRHLEYAAAKAASEVCCHWLASAHPKARVYVARFPRLLTDQTVSFMSEGEEDTLQTIFGHLCAWLPEGNLI